MRHWNQFQFQILGFSVWLWEIEISFEKSVSKSPWKTIFMVSNGPCQLSINKPEGVFDWWEIKTGFHFRFPCSIARNQFRKIHFEITSQSSFHSFKPTLTFFNTQMRKNLGIFSQNILYFKTKYFLNWLKCKMIKSNDDFYAPCKFCNLFWHILP